MPDGFMGTAAPQELHEIVVFWLVLTAIIFVLLFLFVLPFIKQDNKSGNRMLGEIDPEKSLLLQREVGVDYLFVLKNGRIVLER